MLGLLAEAALTRSSRRAHVEGLAPFRAHGRSVPAPHARASGVLPSRLEDGRDRGPAVRLPERHDRSRPQDHHVPVDPHHVRPLLLRRERDHPDVRRVSSSRLQHQRVRPRPHCGGRSRGGEPSLESVFPGSRGELTRGHAGAGWRSMTSTRIPDDFTPNRWAALLAERRASGRALLDLTDTNPTRTGLGVPDADLKDALLRGATLSRYEPDPHGSAEARRAIAGYYAARGDGSCVVD